LVDSSLKGSMFIGRACTRWVMVRFSSNHYTSTALGVFAIPKSGSGRLTFNSKKTMSIMTWFFVPVKIQSFSVALECPTVVSRGMKLSGTAPCYRIFN
jgi:hypothetical protein